MKSKNNLQLEKVGIESVARVQKIIEGAPTFTMNTEGQKRDPDYARRALQALPPGCNTSQKYFFVIKSSEVEVGVADLIQDYPSKGTALLGLLLVMESWQRKGLGRAAYFLLENFATVSLSASKIRLAYIDSNPVCAFWEKLGFKPTGETKPYKGTAKVSTAHVMEKELERVQ